MSAVSIYYLSMTSPNQLVEKVEAKGLSVIEAEIDEYRLNKYLYQLVGEQWQWQDKQHQSDDAWKAYVESPALKTWVAYYRGTIAGYFELKSDGEGCTEIAYFGLAPAFIGRGYGGYLLSQAIKQAWAIEGTTRIEVNTCSLDHEAALKNYIARGFQLVREEVSGS
ncbi:acetyltransferase (GNAT) family protein [Sinobacterium caligoides]|uniref:Acetyltransferase (GNAT) family protein n=1 Tax=Sinobacterium caligoides TaxID=933926 RepID=A0A3N2E079_9GAMM|nr:GNAT family N-acetyltransferase [Sinobacterium caligoides]ROS05494.1 acetyltransferase (GNAT) family protein [Sinobacterium caligoides]